MTTASAFAPPLLAIKDLTVQFSVPGGSVEAVRNLSLMVNSGECLGVVGESGSGKSQTFLAAMGLLSPNGAASGSIRFKGRELLGLEPRRLNSLRGASMSMIFQNPQTALTPHMTIGEQIAETLVAHRGMSRSEAMTSAAAWLAKVRISDGESRLRQYPHELSGGMRQRVMIAAALACGPELIIADEPTTALDVTVQADVLDIMAELLAESGAALVLISHDMGVIARLATRVLVVKDGLRVEEGSVETIFARPQAIYTQTLLKAAGGDSRSSAERKSQTFKPDAAPLVEVKALKVSFPVGQGFLRKKKLLWAVDGVDLQIRPGETLGVVGESGSGKSTLARAVLNLLPAAAGAVTLLGRDLTHAKKAQMREARKDLQIVFQDPTASLNPRMTIGQSVEEPLLVHRPDLNRLERRGAALDILDQVGLGRPMADRYPHELSGGQAQRAAVARAMILKPKLVICDEATSALDVTIRAQIVDLLMTMQEKLGLGMMFISHDLTVVKEIAHRVMVLYLGRVVELGPSRELYEDPRHPYTRALMSAAPIADPVLERSRVRLKLGGEPSSGLDPLSGLRFLPSRLPTAAGATIYRPALVKIGTDHWVAEFDPALAVVGTSLPSAC